LMRHVVRAVAGAGRDPFSKRERSDSGDSCCSKDERGASRIEYQTNGARSARLRLRVLVVICARHEAFFRNEASESLGGCRPFGPVATTTPQGPSA
jgi:hypothetical protein